MAQLLLSSDTLFQGMNKINDWYSGGSISLSSTTNNSLLNVNSTTTVASGVIWGFGLGKGNGLTSGAYTTVLNGSGNTASNNFSLIGNGRSNSVSTAYHTILNGRGNSVSAGVGMSTIVNGLNNVSLGTHNFIGGGNTNRIEATISSIVTGNVNKIYSDNCFIGNGLRNTIQNSSSYSSIVNGYQNTISNNYSFIAGGTRNTASALYSFVIGTKSEAAHNYTIVLGRGGKSRFAGDLVFAYGSGSANVANNKFRVNSSGQIFAVSTSVSTGADYAETMMWLDENTLNEDRVGFFVSAKEDKIYIGNDNIIGIISSNPAILADAADFEWVGCELKDEWGRVQYDIYEKFIHKQNKNNFIYRNGHEWYSEIPNKSNVNGIKISTFEENEYDFIQTIKSPKLNPKFNPNVEYIPRSQRKEYAPVGFLGKLLVRTSEKITGTKVDAGQDGMAKNGTKYHVLKHVKNYVPGSYGIIQILFK